MERCIATQIGPVRIGLLIPTFIGVTIVAFALIRLVPGDPIELLVGERGLSPERHAELRERFGFDRPMWQQYLFFLGNVAQGDLGRSLVTRQPILEEFLTRFPATVELSLCAMLFAGFGMHPIAGLAAAYAGVAGGFSANLLLTSLDPLLAGARPASVHLPEDRPGSLRVLLHVFERHGVSLESIHSSRTPAGEVHFRIGFGRGADAAALAAAVAEIDAAGIGRVLHSG
jgi:hypothetical protein